MTFHSFYLSFLLSFHLSFFLSIFSSFYDLAAPVVVSAQVTNAKERVLTLKAYLDEIELYLFPDSPNAAREGIAGKAGKSLTQRKKLKAKEESMERERRRRSSAVVYNPAKKENAFKRFNIFSTKEAKDASKALSKTSSERPLGGREREINQGIKLKPDYERLAAYLYVR